MYRQNKRRNNPKRMEQVVHAAPQAHPVSNQGEGSHVNSDSERPRRPWKEEKMAMSYTIHNLKYKLERLEGLMDLREREFKAEFKTKYEIIASHEATISNLKKDLQFREAQVESLKNRSNQEKDDVAARLEAEQQKLSEQNNHMFQLDLDKQKSILLQIDLQMKQLEELEQELQQKDDIILHLKKENKCLSNKLTEATDQLTNNKAEFLQSNQGWQTKYETLQEKFSQLEVKEQSWKTSVEQMEEQKKELEELSMKLKESKKETTEYLLQSNDWQAKCNALEEKIRQQLEKEHSREEKTTQVEETNQEVEETTKELEENQQILEVTVCQVDVDETEPEDICFRTEEETEVKQQSTTDKKMRKKEKKAIQIKQKQEMEDLKRKQQEEDKDLKGKQKLEKLQEKEMKKREAQMKVELQKRAKEEKKERKRKEKERKNGGDKCDSDAKVEQAAGCSIECQQ